MPTRAKSRSKPTSCEMHDPQIILHCQPAVAITLTRQILAIAETNRPVWLDVRGYVGMAAPTIMVAETEPTVEEAL